jgi:hypothetical protein
MQPEPTIGTEQPEADTLEQQQPAGADDEEPEPAQQSEASDGDLADQARAIGPDEIYEAQHEQP